MTIMLDAAGIIGSDSPADYRLTPVEHADQLRISAPKLAALLTRTAPVELARQYADCGRRWFIPRRGRRCGLTGRTGGGVPGVCTGVAATDIEGLADSARAAFKVSRSRRRAQCCRHP
jgi:hypothetical protein